jgi:hypothetical protein
LVEECVDAHKTCGRSPGKCEKFVPFFGAVGCGVVIADLVKRRAVRFGHACIAAIMEWRANTTLVSADFEVRVEHGAMRFGLPDGLT